ncbi:hypothetical protein [Nocardia sp. CC201C]|uniref:hypothetical protein n=1 Tax=Nocardia sp. CC201C TaxID=3044575 RepID=UPI0024A7C7FB|nr:hypothetical protein [Nocardia sp. CC201C]
MNSGYQYCGCGGCFDITVGTLGTRSLCGLCDEAGCVIGDTDCQREDADTPQCQHTFRIAMNGFSEECVHCGLRVEIDEPDFTDSGTDHGSP